MDKNVNILAGMRLLPLFCAGFILFSCQTKKQTGGPYFGNGFHNGWADQNSIVIWTRLTKHPEGNATGAKFLVPSAEEHRQLDKAANPEAIYDAQNASPERTGTKI